MNSIYKVSNDPDQNASKPNHSDKGQEFKGSVLDVNVDGSAQVDSHRDNRLKQMQKQKDRKQDLILQMGQPICITNFMVDRTLICLAIEFIIVMLIVLYAVGNGYMTVDEIRFNQSMASGGRMEYLIRDHEKTQDFYRQIAAEQYLSSLELQTIDKMKEEANPPVHRALLEPLYTAHILYKSKDGSSINTNEDFQEIQAFESSIQALSAWQEVCLTGNDLSHCSEFESFLSPLDFLKHYKYSSKDKSHAKAACTIAEENDE